VAKPTGEADLPKNQFADEVIERLLLAQSGRSLQSSRQVSVHDHGSRGSRSIILVT
jgi:hypothetical protein